MQDFPGMLERKEIVPSCLFDPDRAASLEHFVRLNYEGFFFCGADEAERFRADPTRFCGFLTDPVEKRRFRPTTASPSAEHEGTLFLFEDARSIARFRAAPTSFVLPGWKMAPMPESPDSPEPDGPANG